MTERVITYMAEKHPQKAVFLDVKLQSSAEKGNLLQIFQTVSPETNVKVI